MYSFKRRKQVITDVIPILSPLAQAAASLLLSFSSFIQLLSYSPLLGLFMKCIHWCSHRFAWFSADLFFSLTIFSRALCWEKPSPQLSEQKILFKLQLKWFTYGHIKHHIVVRLCTHIYQWLLLIVRRHDGFGSENVQSYSHCKSE